MSEVETPPETLPEEANTLPPPDKAASDEKVVNTVMKERQETKKPKRKVVKDNKGRDGFLKAKKVRTNKKAGPAANLSDGFTSDKKKIMIGGLVVGALAAGVAYASTSYQGAASPMDLLTGEKTPPPALSNQSAAKVMMDFLTGKTAPAQSPPRPAPAPVVPVANADDAISVPVWLRP